MGDFPELPKRIPLKAPRPEPELKTAEEMFKAIRRIMKRQLIQANESRYDVMVCIRSVGAASAALEGVPVEGTAIEYGNAVMATLDELHEDFWDSDGEYTSRGRIGDVCFDVDQLLARQWTFEHPEIDVKEARGVLFKETAELSRNLSGPLGKTGENTIKFEAEGPSGRTYYVDVAFEVTAPREFDMLGKIYADAARQILIYGDRLALIDDDGT